MKQHERFRMSTGTKKSEKTRAIQQLISDAEHVVFLTGAGTSTEAGIPDFKSIDSHWKHAVDRRTLFSKDYFWNNKDMFWNVFKEEFGSKMNVEPSSFHTYIASLENDQRKVSVITQNIDNLHREAGSTNVLGAHGTIATSTCTNRKCLAQYSTWELSHQPGTPYCDSCGALLKPDVTLFGEQLAVDFERIMHEMWTCSLLVVAGTSLDVSPINYIPTMLKREQRHTTQVWVNREKPPTDDYGINLYDFNYQVLSSLGDFTNAMTG